VRIGNEHKVETRNIKEYFTNYWTQKNQGN